MNKKGIKLLGEETIKGLIGIICLAFLIILLFSVYFTSQRNSKLIQAKETLNKPEGIIAAIKSLESSSDGFKEVSVFAPKGWHIFGFIYSTPDSCLGEKCICICEKLLIGNQNKRCDEKGTCFIVSNLNKYFSIKIEPTTKLSVIKKDGLIGVKEI